MNSTIARLTQKSLLRGWRGWLLAAIPAVQLLVIFAIRAFSSPSDTLEQVLLREMTLGTVVPLLSVIIATGAINTEVDDGSIAYLLMKPIRRGRILLVKAAVAIATTFAFAVVPAFVAAIVVTGKLDSGTWAYTLAAAICAVVYCAVFLMVGVRFKQAMTIGLLYVVFWENLVVGLVDGLRILSVQYWATSLASKVSTDAFSADVNVVAAAVLASVATVAALWYGTRRLRVLTLVSQE